MAKSIKQMTVKEWEEAFPTDQACADFLIAQRWPHGPFCPRCGSTKVYKLAQPYKWECPDCRQGGAYKFSHLVGTIFENTNLPLRTWFRVIHMMLTSKKGVSALQVHRTIGTGSYRSAWYMCHRIRAGMQDKDLYRLMGVVEVDETLIGGKLKNKHRSKRDGDGDGGPHGGNKTAIAGAVSRKGRVVARVIASTRRKTLEYFVRAAVSDKVSLLVTDEHTGYNRLAETYPHETVNHSRGEYVNGVLHTNTIEGFWSILKRGVIGTYHKVSKKYLPLYVAEFQFRYNNRDNPDIFKTAIAGC